MISRRRSREFLLQSLYSRSEVKSAFDRESFIASYFNEWGESLLELAYIDRMEQEIFTHEDSLIEIVSLLAPKFELSTIPIMHILIIMIALTEILYVRDFEIPESVSINEAIELAKTFSDDQGRIFINGALSKYIKEREKIMTEKKSVLFRVF